MSSTRRLLSPEPASSDFHLSPCCPGIEGSAFSSTELWASLDAWVSRSASEREREARPVSAKLVDRCFTPEYKAELSELECDMWCSGYHIVLLDCLYCWRCINAAEKEPIAPAPATSGLERLKTTCLSTVVGQGRS